MLMSAYLFLVIAVFWIQKPIKKTRFFEYYGTRNLEIGSLVLSAASMALAPKANAKIAEPVQPAALARPKGDAPGVQSQSRGILAFFSIEPCWNNIPRLKTPYSCSLQFP